ncbi:hypothetical protein ACGFS9_24705 [Streptomyces sp. NPDC048566]|uniref:hypothetical protein n=1 Tax=Streptomyces sp. NPDC048566 TaxID=3365569 RepID=UPI0037159D3C
MIRSGSLLAVCAFFFVVIATITTAPRATAVAPAHRSLAAGGGTGVVAQHNPWG